MKEKSAEDILKSDSENFEIPYSDIVALKLTLGQRFETRGLFLEIYMDELNAPKHRIRLCLKPKYFSMFEEFLRTILPEKI